MIVYNCWITCLLESYQNTIIISLVKRGYTVGLTSMGNVNQPNQVSAILSFSIYKIDEKKLTLAKVLDDLNIILTDAKMYFYSIVVSEHHNATWAGSNIIVQNTKSVPLLPSAPDKKSKLN